MFQSERTSPHLGLNLDCDPFQAIDPWLGGPTAAGSQGLARPYLDPGAADFELAAPFPRWENLTLHVGYHDPPPQGLAWGPAAMADDAEVGATADAGVDVQSGWPQQVPTMLPRSSSASPPSSAPTSTNVAAAAAASSVAGPAATTAAQVQRLADLFLAHKADPSDNRDRAFAIELLQQHLQGKDLMGDDQLTEGDQAQLRSFRGFDYGAVREVDRVPGHADAYFKEKAPRRPAQRDVKFTISSSSVKTSRLDMRRLEFTDQSRSPVTVYKKRKFAGESVAHPLCETIVYSLHAKKPAETSLVLHIHNAEYRGRLLGVKKRCSK